MKTIESTASQRKIKLDSWKEGKHQIFWLQYVILKRCNKMWSLSLILKLLFFLHFMWLPPTIQNERKKRKEESLEKYNPINFGLLGNHHAMNDVHIIWLSSSSLSSSLQFLYHMLWECQKATLWLFVAFGAIGRFYFKNDTQCHIMSFAPLAMFNVGVFTAAAAFSLCLYCVLVTWKWKPKVQFQSRNVYRLWVEIWFGILAGA